MQAPGVFNSMKYRSDKLKKKKKTKLKTEKPNQKMFDSPNKFSLLKFLTDLPIVFVSRP